MSITIKRVYTYFAANSVVALHILIGVSVYYLLIHPITMAIYWFEFNNNNQTNFTLADIIAQRFLHAFSLHMTGMSLIFPVPGAISGTASGIYYKRIRNKNKLLIKQEQFISRDIEQTIKLGENEYTEFKSSIRYDYSKKATNKELEIVIVKSIAGFMNGNGGKLIIGIADNGEVPGLAHDYATLRNKNRDGFERRVYEIISCFLGAEFCSLAHIYFHTRQEKEFCVINIGKSSSPAYVNSEKNTIFYLRTGNATIPLSVKETVNYIQLNKIK
ncbi:MAG: ATP-binding protein [Chitinophagaceae bacterium]|nr:ATP-binding protein [Chitinophagaceae bacterium]